MNAEKLNSKLKELGIQYKQSDQWLLKAPYDRWGMHDEGPTFSRAKEVTPTPTHIRSGRREAGDSSLPYTKIIGM